MGESEQQDRSFRLLDEHRESLAAEARELVARHPSARPVGLILAPDASEATELGRALEQATGQGFAGRGFVGLVPRDFALTILRANAPATLDWLEPEAEGRLPLICATKDGFRLGSIGYEVP